MVKYINTLLITSFLIVTSINVYAAPDWGKLKKVFLKYFRVASFNLSEYEVESLPGEVVLIGYRKSTYPEGANLSGYHKLRYLLASQVTTGAIKKENGWSESRHSEHVRVCENGLKLERGRRSQQTDACFGKKNYGSGVYLWEVQWSKEQRGSHAVIGIITEEGTPLSGDGYKNIIGSDKYSYGWDMVENKIIHDGEVIKDYPEQSLQDSEQSLAYVAPEEILLILDMDHGCLSFVEKGTGEFLGQAVTGLQGKQCSPAISAVWGRCEIGLNYVAGVNSGPLKLQELCKLSIYDEFGKSNQENVPNKNCLPERLQQFLNECNDLKIEVKEGFD